ncbi:MAG: hypothetical protein KC493_09215 [Bacteriovoracaceae bacterium]|nr:hypothetical protein [Bacteriovoracaceae bacterium]
MIKIILCSKDSKTFKYFSEIEGRLPMLDFKIENMSNLDECAFNGTESLFFNVKSKSDLALAEEFSKKVADFFLYFNLNELDESLKEKINLLYTNAPHVTGLIDTSNPLEFHLPMFASSIRERLESKLDLGNVTQQMNKIVGRSLAELQRLKRLHEKIVPMRNESFKGLSILSKFGAGESSGGEFFDIVKGDKEFLVLVTSSTSYVVSSMVLTHFEYFRDKESFSNAEMEKFLTDLSADIRERGFESDERMAEIFLMRIDLNSLQIEGHQFGEFELKSIKGVHTKSNELPLDDMFFEKSYFKSKLDRGEKLLILSPGVFRNFQTRKQELKKNFYEGLFDLVPNQMINEIFFQMKKEVVGDFLNHDATVIYLEVDPNVIVQV